MCGIIGLLARSETLRASFGEQMMPMFRCMAERGPDSAGLAVYNQPGAAATRRYSLFAFRHDVDWKAIAASFEKETGESAKVQSVDNHAVFVTADEFAVEIELAAVTNAFKLEKHFASGAVWGQFEVFAIPGDAGAQVFNVFAERIVFVPRVRCGDSLPA